jgi:hypothetical protein
VSGVYNGEYTTKDVPAAFCLIGKNLNSPAPGKNLVEVQALGGLGFNVTHASKR